MAAVAFAISGTITGLAGAILGGFDKIGLAIVGGVLVGVVESFAASTISTAYQEVIVLGLLLVLLIVRPSGLTRMRVSERV